MNSSKKKGDELEAAVRAIESAILRAVPGLEEGTFEIVGNKIIKVDGVRHEIDVYVTASLAVGYESVFIFECKNWRRTVGKNELIVFSEKIAVSGAQRGFFVASKFSRDAKNQAKKDQRIQLLTGTHFAPVTRVMFPQLQFLSVTATDADVRFVWFGEEVDGKLKPIDLSGKPITVEGELLDASTYLNEKIVRARDAKLNPIGWALPEGKQMLDFSDELEFDEGAVIFEERPLRRIEINGKAEVRRATGSVRSVFEIGTRGRMLMVAADAGAIEVEMQVVELPSSTGVVS